MDRAPRTALAILALVAAAVALLRVPQIAGTVQDDGFIYFRIAENVAAGHGPVFNPGERVDAATSPAWLALLSLAARFGAPLPLASLVLGLAATLGAILLTARWSLELASPRGWLDLGLALLPPALLALDTRFLLYAGSGMETPLTGVAWVWATRALVRRWIEGRPEPRAPWALLVAGVVRPEYALVAAGLAAFALVRRTLPPRALAKSLLPAAVGAALYLAAHALYFGDTLPNTYHAKRAWDATHARIGLAYVAGLPRTYPAFLALLAALAVPPLRRTATGIVLGLVFYTAHVTSLGGDHFVYYRPYVVLLPVALALCGAAFARLVHPRHLAIRVAAAALGAAALLETARLRVEPGAFAWVRLASQLGHALARTYPPETRVGMFAIGAAGYTSRLPVVDALGLADRHVARRDLSHEHACALDIGHERGDPEYVLEHSDVVVLFGAYAPVRLESLDEVREGFYSHKRFLAAARAAVESRRFRLRDLEFAPGAHWLLLEKVR